jgi:UDP-glucose 4-epimerase
MSVIVTGSAGYIGSHMVWTLADRGEDVIVVDDLSKGFDWAVAPEAELVVADLGDQMAMEALFRSRGNTLRRQHRGT